MLHWAINNSNYSELDRIAQTVKNRSALPTPEDGTQEVRPSFLAGMDPETFAERQEELREMADGMFGQNVRIMKKALSVAVNTSHHSTENRVAALDTLYEMVDQIDNARDFKTIGGWSKLQPLLEDKQAEVRASSAWVLGTCVQNSAELQQYSVQQGVLKPLLQLLHADAELMVRRRALYALSGTVRGCLACTAAFVSEGGVDVLVAAMSDEQKVQQKALVLLTDLLEEAPGANWGPSQQLLSDADAPFCQAVQRFLEQRSNVDTAEKALHALGVLAKVWKGGLDGHAQSPCLQRLQQSTQQLQTYCDAAAYSDSPWADLKTPIISVLKQLG